MDLYLKLCEVLPTSSSIVPDAQLQKCDFYLVHVAYILANSVLIHFL
jgi:hypothetical protein